ncbi:MAG: response regulator transcription factor [Fimbriimonadaceae bacterium]|nr:response regulator transcription factor [Fimbriimonadaceae bacterium]
MADKIMVVEDDPAIQRSLAALLGAEGYEVVVTADGAEAVQLATAAAPQLILLDVVLPGLNGLQVCQQLRARIYTPIIMLTAKSDELDKVLGLEMGADDYVTKPFSPRELLARVRAHLRRSTLYEGKSAEDGPLTVGAITIDEAAREVTVAGKVVQLTPKEFDLLLVLAASAGRVLARDDLLERVWGESLYLDSRTLDVHIRRLRLKIEPEPSAPQFIVTVPGVGYKMTAADRQPGRG